MRKLLIFSLLVLLLPSLAEAQKAKFEITPSIGYRPVGEFDINQNAGFLDESEIDESEILGLSLSIPLNDILQLELMTNHQESELIDDQGLFNPSAVVADIEIDNYHVGLVGNFPTGGQAQPYIVGSLGITQLEVTNPLRGEDEKFSLSFGGGVKFYFSDNFGLRIEGRSYYIDLDGDEGEDAFDDRNSLILADASFGLVFAW